MSGRALWMPRRGGRAAKRVRVRIKCTKQKNAEKWKVPQNAKINGRVLRGEKLKGSDLALQA